MYRTINLLTQFLGLGLLSMGVGHASTLDFNDCTEFVGVAAVDFERARALVPSQYTLVTDNAGAKLVVRVTGCESVRVGLQKTRPARVAQVGIMVYSPDGTGTDPNTSINNYTLSYATDLPALAGALRLAGVPATIDPNLAYEFTQGDPAELYAAVTQSLQSWNAWTLYGTIHTPTYTTTFLANWWLVQGSREIKMESVFPVIAFDFASRVSLFTSRQSALGLLLKANRIENFPLSFRGAYSFARMRIEIR
jgi:hypothetical protein